MNDIKNEKPTWKLNLTKWRIANKYTSNDWNAYASARTDQANIMAFCIGLICFILGYISGQAV